MAVSKANAKGTPEAQLKSLIDKFDPKEQRLIRSVRAAVRKRLPTANEVVYDYGFSLLIGYSPTDRGIDSPVSIATRDGGLRLYFMNGPKLPDPKKLLVGSAKQVRFIPLEAASRLKHPDVEALIAGAIKLASASMPAKGGGTVIIKATTASKRAGKKSAK
jgi:hypothetical protein